MDIEESVDDMLNEIKRLYMVLRSTGLFDDDEGMSWFGASSKKPYKGGWKSSIYLREPLLPTSVAGMCLGGDTPEALALRDSLVKRDPTLVNFMRDALKNGACAVCLSDMLFEVDPECRVVVSVAKQLLKVTCSPKCYETMIVNIDPCLVFWYQKHDWSKQQPKKASPASSTSSSASASPSATHSRTNPRSVGAPKRSRTGASALDESQAQHVRRRLFPADD